MRQNRLSAVDAENLLRRSARAAGREFAQVAASVVCSGSLVDSAASPGQPGPVVRDPVLVHADVEMQSPVTAAQLTAAGIVEGPEVVQASARKGLGHCWVISKRARRFPSPFRGHLGWTCHTALTARGQRQLSKLSGTGGN
jgi:hypothetical protein